MTSMFPAWTNGLMLVCHAEKTNAERGKNLDEKRQTGDEKVGLDLT